MFIAHEQVNTKTDYISPKGDKRCVSPILDKCDYVVYLKSNGVDENGKVIHSSGYLAETSEFFARAKIEHTPTFIKDFTAENLTAAIQEGIQKKKELDGSTVTTFEEQQKLNTVSKLDFKKIKEEFYKLIASIPGSSDTTGATKEGIEFREKWVPRITRLTEKYLGKGLKVEQCNENQAEALSLIVNDLAEMINS